MFFREKHPKRATVPGRVNLIGEWIDFNGGTVLPMALGRSVHVEIHPNERNQDSVSSKQFPDRQTFDLEAPAAGHWSDYVRGGLQYARHQGWLVGGQDVSVASSIPVGAGLSSSAATIVATLKAAAHSEHAIDPVDIAIAARKIENDFIGVPCGIMDQMAVAIGKPGDVLALDTKDLTCKIMQLPDDWTIAVVHSGIGRALSDGRYRMRREECLEAAETLNVDYLCRADLSSTSRLAKPLAQRARHVISEGHRSKLAIEAIRRGDRHLFGRLMNESHASLRDDMDVSIPAIDSMIEDCVHLGADGARITGAGFGGCFLCLLAPDKADSWWNALKARHAGLNRIT